MRCAALRVDWAISEYPVFAIRMHADGSGHHPTARAKTPNSSCISKVIRGRQRPLAPNRIQFGQDGRGCRQAGRAGTSSHCAGSRVAPCAVFAVQSAYVPECLRNPERGKKTQSQQRRRRFRRGELNTLGTADDSEERKTPRRKGRQGSLRHFL